MKAEGVLPVEDVWHGRTWWRYDGVSPPNHTYGARLTLVQYYQMPDPDPEDKLGLDWYGVAPPEEGLYHKK
jgi:membrane dipeptidase